MGRPQAAAAPVTPFLGSRRILVVALVAVAALGGLAASGLGDSLVYYRTPTELQARPPGPDERLRLGGMVVPGSVAGEGDRVRFTLTDGASDVAVVHTGTPQGVFREGQGALVEGSVDGDGVFRSDLLMVKHDNEYRPVEPATVRPGVEGATR